MSLYIGLMSGTSMDGVDAVLCDIKGSSGGVKIKILDSATAPISAKFAGRLSELCKGGSVAQTCELNVEVGRLFSVAAVKLIRKAKVDTSRIEAIGSHGQTVWHNPAKRATLQIGDAAVIASWTGVNTWFDFRSADMAAGGQGAPLAPVVHLPLFVDKNVNVSVVNIGGIANMTHIPAGAKELNELMAYDTGPGCMLMDLGAQAAGAGRFDKNGALAREGKAGAKLLKKFLTHPYLERTSPKSTGREEFGEEFLRWARISKSMLRGKNMLAALTELTALTIINELERLDNLGRATGRIVLCGGGAKNGYLVSRIQSLAGEEVDVVTSDKLGVPVKLVEPALMALLAFYAEKGVRLDLGNLTGSQHPVLAGKLAR